MESIILLCDLLLQFNSIAKSQQTQVGAPKTSCQTHLQSHMLCKDRPLIWLRLLISSSVTANWLVCNGSMYVCEDVVRVGLQMRVRVVPLAMQITQLVSGGVLCACVSNGNPIELS